MIRPWIPLRWALLIGLLFYMLAGTVGPDLGLSGLWGEGDEPQSLPATPPASLDITAVQDFGHQAPWGGYVPAVGVALEGQDILMTVTVPCDATDLASIGQAVERLRVAAQARQGYGSYTLLLHAPDSQPLQDLILTVQATTPIEVVHANPCPTPSGASP